MLNRLDEASDERIKALREIGRDKLRVVRGYNKKVKEKSFQVVDFIWKMILPIGSKSNKFGKWSSNWEWPYRIEEVIPGNSYIVQSVQGTSLPRALNGKYLKSTIPIFGKTLELETADNKIIALSTKMTDETLRISPSEQIWSKMHLIHKLN
jgi:hypothetical protein